MHDDIAARQHPLDRGLDQIGRLVALDDRLPRRNGDDHVCEVAPGRLAQAQAAELDVGTEIGLASARVLDLRRGAVYVDTGAAPSQDSAATADGAAIEISTPLGRVREVGTQFEVRLLDGALDVSVREGTAALTRGDRTFTAPAGTHLRVGPAGANARRPAAGRAGAVRGRRHRGQDRRPGPQQK